jgi:hypothetical protein
VGYYHVHKDTDGAMIYMEGEYHTDASHDILQPLATRVNVPIGTVSSYGEAIVGSEAEKIFMVEKYISHDGVKFSPDSTLSLLSNKAAGYSSEQMPNISDLYPGTLEHALDPLGTGRVLGLTGELGLRYGLEFSVIINGQKTSITTVEVDVLDSKINNIMPFDDNSKLLLCLINMLKKDEKFRMLTKYVFPLNKILSIMAIYCDMAFLPSIGEWTVNLGDTLGPLATAETKPGVMASVTKDGAGRIVAVDTAGNPGWANVIERQAAAYGTLFVKEWDDWDKVLLRKSKSYIKRQFKRYYYFRDWNFDGFGGWPRPGQIVFKNLRDAFKPKIGQKLVPRWKKRKIRENPFDSNNQLCSDED